MLGSQVIAFCKFCNQSYIQNATRMERHMERCPKCPEDVRQQFIQVAHNKKHKSNNLDNKVNDGWPKQESSVDQNITDTDLEDLDDWNYKNQSYLVETSNAMQQNMELVMQNNEQNWVNQDNAAENNNTDTSLVSRNWETSQSDTGTVVPAGSQERSSSVHQRKSYNPRRISQWPVSTVQTSDCSPLQSKIYQEQLLERRALRRAAELEVQRKALELERFQWEYERDKLQTEVRWAHETRMMQLKEDRERQLTEQTRIKTVSHVV
ncbi:hypothetical protein WN48_07196 [Eufriesea mexicana]|uniref:Uncharacterized protein n=2 Tax=Eufriesea mexicana TaxID=516756 RepID=A0A310SSU4_9HYME|nr:hypothetical protein WN48_07196 [Eufriesea mexicana]